MSLCLRSRRALSAALTRLPTLLCLLTLSACSSLPAPGNRLPAPFVQALLQAGVNDAHVALDIRAVDAARADVSLHADQPFQPASIMKLVTSEAALALLGPDYRWVTRVHASGTLDGDTLAGDLIIEGSGDPRFAHEDLARLLRALRQTGLRKIQGDLVLDRSLFRSAAVDPAAFDSQPERAYNALPDALLLDAGALTVRLQADGDRVLLSSEPPLAGFTIEPPVATDGPCGRVREQLQPELSALGLRFAGAYPLACGERTLAFHLHTLPQRQYVEAVFRALWAELGGSLTGTVRDGPVPADSRELMAWPSRPLAQVLVDMNKQSNNVMARNLMLSLVAQRGGEAATEAAAAERVMAWMADSGLTTQGVVIDNGSGLSRAERLPAATLAALLQHAWRQPTMPELLASLPVAGVDGTMVARHGDSAVRGHAHIKTGSLTGVASIAGYVTARSGRRMIVVCMVNDAQAGAARPAFGALLDWVYANY